MFDIKGKLIHGISVRVNEPPDWQVLVVYSRRKWSYITVEEEARKAVHNWVKATVYCVCGNELE